MERKEAFDEANGKESLPGGMKEFGRDVGS
jgi:hypothetical protein